MPKMNPELKAKWVAALRDPNRKQAKGQLRIGDAMCCLGVLCDVIDPAGWTLRENRSFTYGDYYTMALPPKEVSELLGFSPDSEYLAIDGWTRQAHIHNDVGNVTFLQIADAIEEQW